MAGRHRAIAQGAVILGLSLGLSGCIAAAVPLMVAEAGAVGFSGYKLIQTTTGGKVGVRFGTGSGKQEPPAPLPAVKRVAVWPEEEGNVMFANDLEKSGRFTVTAPDKVSAILTRADIASNPKMVTDQEMDAGYAAVCRSTGASLIFASRTRGSKSKTNMWSLSRATQTFTADLMTYSCRKHAVVWRDTLSVVVELGESNIPSSDEINRIAAKAWAGRIEQAMSEGGTQKTASAKEP